MRRLLVALLLLLTSFGTAPTAGAQGQGVTLDFPSWQAEEPGFGEWWKGLIQEYEAKHPGVKVRLYSIPFANYVNQLTVRFAGQNPPDIVHLPSRNFASFASQNWLEPMPARTFTMTSSIASRRTHPRRGYSMSRIT